MRRHAMPFAYRPRGWWWAVVFALIALTAQSQEPVACPEGPAVVSQASAAEFEVVCEAARAAADFLQSAGAQVPPRIQIHIVAAMPQGVPADSPGCFARATKRVILLQWAAFERRCTWLGVAADLALYRSVATHELAHAIARGQQPPRPMSKLAHEYLANVTMYATMGAELRERLLAAHPGTGYDHERQINILDYLFDPALFGANAYRHWAKHADPTGLLRRVLEGTAIVEIERE